MGSEIVLFESSDNAVTLNVDFDGDTVWLTQAQMAELFSTTKQNISLHVNNCYREGELDKSSVVKESLTTATDGKRYKTKKYNLDVIISVGYRVKSQRGVEFRRWATDILRRYIIQGHAENAHRLQQLGQVAQIMARIPDNLETRQVLDIIQSYASALDLLDDYDHQRISTPKGSDATYVLEYEECLSVIGNMRFGNESALMIAESKPEEKDAMVAPF